MVSTSVAPWHICSYPISRLHSNGSRLSNRRAFTTCLLSKARTHFKNNCSLFLTSTNSCTPHQDKKNNASYASQNHIFLEQLHSSIATDKVTKQAHKTGDEEDREETAAVFKDKLSISTNMWWADLKAALSQRINLEGLVSSVAVVGKDRHLALPHIAVPDIRYIDWAELKREGFRGVVFDKDNTITVPYSLTLWAPLGSSLERCKSIFGNDIAVFSNSAGLRDYDPDGRKARALEGAVGIKVIRHSVKKPAGTAEEIEKHFGCESSRLVMVGDRPFTDVVYGNRNGFLTVLTEPLSLAEEPFIVKQVRKVEIALVNRWSRRGLKPASHRLLPDVMRCVKDPPVL